MRKRPSPGGSSKHFGKKHPQSFEQLKVWSGSYSSALLSLALLSRASQAGKKRPPLTALNDDLKSGKLRGGDADFPLLSRADHRRSWSGSAFCDPSLLPPLWGAGPPGAHPKRHDPASFVIQKFALAKVLRLFRLARFFMPMNRR